MATRTVIATLPFKIDLTELATKGDVLGFKKEPDEVTPYVEVLYLSENNKDKTLLREQYEHNGEIVVKNGAWLDGLDEEEDIRIRARYILKKGEKTFRGNYSRLDDILFIRGKIYDPVISGLYKTDKAGTPIEFGVLENMGIDISTPRSRGFKLLSKTTYIVLETSTSPDFEEGTILETYTRTFWDYIKAVNVEEYTADKIRTTIKHSPSQAHIRTIYVRVRYYQDMVRSEWSEPYRIVVPYIQPPKFTLRNLPYPISPQSFPVEGKEGKYPGNIGEGPSDLAYPGFAGTIEPIDTNIPDAKHQCLVLQFSNNPDFSTAIPNSFVKQIDCSNRDYVYNEDGSGEYHAYAAPGGNVNYLCVAEVIGGYHIFVFGKIFYRGAWKLTTGQIGPWSEHGEVKLQKKHDYWVPRYPTEGNSIKRVEDEDGLRTYIVPGMCDIWTGAIRSNSSGTRYPDYYYAAQCYKDKEFTQPHGDVQNLSNRWGITHKDISQDEFYYRLCPRAGIPAWTYVEWDDEQQKPLRKSYNWYNEPKVYRDFKIKVNYGTEGKVAEVCKHGEVGQDPSRVAVGKLVASHMERLKDYNDDLPEGLIMPPAVFKLDTFSDMLKHPELPVAWNHSYTNYGYDKTNSNFYFDPKNPPEETDFTTFLLPATEGETIAAGATTLTHRIKKNQEDGCYYLDVGFPTNRNVEFSIYTPNNYFLDKPRKVKLAIGWTRNSPIWCGRSLANANIERFIDIWLPPKTGYPIERTDGEQINGVIYNNVAYTPPGILGPYFITGRTGLIEQTAITGLQYEFRISNSLEGDPLCVISKDPVRNAVFRFPNTVTNDLLASVDNTLYYRFRLYNNYWPARTWTPWSKLIPVKVYLSPRPTSLFF